MILAVFGYKGSGKSAVAKRFELHNNFIRRPIAAPLKEMLKAMGLTATQLWGSEKEKPSVLLGGQTARYAMQTLG
ncbi:MAG: deoxynucleotide monophosphate kinase, partial [Myxococcales bacterium]